MSVSREEILRQFCDVTGADDARSRFFLESSNWQLEIALSSFYEHGGNIDNPPQALDQGAVQVLSDSDMDSDGQGPPMQPQKKDKKPKPSGNQRFATLSTLQQQESSSDEEEGQAFFAGGSERSGQQILGPSKNKKDIVTEMFKTIRERGAVAFEDEPSSASRGGATFGGVGYRLGQTPDDHEAVDQAGAESQALEEAHVQQWTLLVADMWANDPVDIQDAVRSVRLRLYREGFTVDDATLRPYTDPVNSEFLNCIRRGEIPPELAAGGGEVRVSLEDRRTDCCPKPSGKAHAFQGKGHLLGSPTPPTVGATAPLAANIEDRAANERNAQTHLKLDSSQPTTTVQFRLADGSRLTGQFNHTHTVGDLRQYLVTAVPIYQLQTFVLQTTFPSVELSDNMQTLKDANLLNSVIVQRLK